MNKNYILYSLLLFFFFQDINAFAQNLLKSIPTEEARFITTDELGNVYLVREDNALIRYNNNGDSTGNFRSIQNGELKSIDASNPLRILLYYSNASKILLLDRMLSVKNELDLKKLQIFNAPVVAMSTDGKIWVYDYVNARLKKFDDQLNITNTGNDMRQESQTVPNPAVLIERDSKVYMADPQNGIYTFDRFAGYINTLEIKNVYGLQIFGTQLVYPEADSLISYDLQTLARKAIQLPGDKKFLQARMERNRLYFLFETRLEIYEIGNEEGEK
ncbi:hypothetical protein F0919_12850 [Taibaiella lutea]|uniref:6-bladed beta-propeller n=1 Tax=Taibaiella lutea TaxID=2608001 RepID=A0A5M6CE31_9BACT|nr:hypothetical protein [Taibaiella lutea]KAA5533424.1 hypothetical protein F0919_12850 [Taibaiella lutea]